MPNTLHTDRTSVPVLAATPGDLTNETEVEVKSGLFVSATPPPVEPLLSPNRIDVGGNNPMELSDAPKQEISEMSPALESMPIEGLTNSAENNNVQEKYALLMSGLANMTANLNLGKLNPVKRTLAEKLPEPKPVRSRSDFARAQTGYTKEQKKAHRKQQAEALKKTKLQEKEKKLLDTLLMKVRVDPDTSLQYQNFINKLDEALNQLESKSYNVLGAFSSSAEYYFDSSKESDQNCFEFMQTLLSYPGSDEIIKNSLIKKYLETGKTAEPISPNNISFVNITIGKAEDKYCLVAISSYEKCTEEFKYLIEQTLLRLSISSSGHTFIMLEGDPDRISLIIERSRQQIPGAKSVRHTMRPCSEKFFVHFLVKLFGLVSQELKVEGITNSLFYGYSDEIDYGVKKAPFPDEAQSKITIQNIEEYMSKPFSKGNRRERLLIGNRQVSLELIPCCVNCQANKPSVANILMTAYGFNRFENNPYRDQPTSPLANSIAQFSRPQFSKYLSLEAEDVPLLVAVSAMEAVDNLQPSYSPAFYPKSLATTTTTSHKRQKPEDDSGQKMTESDEKRAKI
ncbi:hypothetical protein ACFORL_03165 [Legionella dresdenensis]|uniref:Dot/Icm T4SS effector n=1 Tax=Legionella dresdenensis TaxID=450200 RepID=A0ABV8CDP5_9GAMM